MGEQGLQQAYQQFIQEYQQQAGAVQQARKGAKINYLSQLRGECPAGTVLQYFKAGGRVCKRCVAAQKGVKTDPVEEFREGRKMRKASCGAALGKKKLK